MFKKIFLLSMLIVFTVFYQAQSITPKFHNELTTTSFIDNEEILIKSKNNFLITIDLMSLNKVLKKTFYNTNKAKEDILLSLPLPDGSSSVFRIVRNNVMHPDLARKFPEIKTFDAVNVADNSITAKLDLTPQGFHAMILRHGKSTVFIDPYLKNNKSIYTCYLKEDFITDKTMKCSFSGKMDVLKMKLKQDNYQKSFGTCELRTYRLALAATGEYTAYHGGTAVLAQAAQVTTMNRVNGIYERDMAITMQIIANNNLLIYTNSSTDPYTNGSPGSMITENQSTVNSVIGSSNYDIGHVFGTNSGGLAGLGVVCSNSQKARGVTGSSNPVGDPFDVDYVCHEMGHQFGANHTFNNSCSGNRNDPTAVEPGSGNTIMGYAGICSPNTQSLSDDHFHGISLEEIETEILSGPHTCPVVTSITNSPPVISSTNGNVTIPANTPFALTATVTDPDGDPLTYNWEQINNDITSQPPLSTATGGPNFRSNPSLSSPTRYFPNLTDLANGGPFTWEVIPTVSRTMDFRVVVRDNAVGGGCNDHADITLTTDVGSGPFVLTYPSASGITWNASATETVTWNVANTDNAPVNCTNVDLLLSIDGGVTYTTTLVSNVSNDGSEDITVPNLPTTTARVMVVAANGTFFDISDNDFAITGTSCNNPDIPVIAGLDTACLGDTVVLSISSGNLNDATDWQWYEGTCGGTAIGNGTSVNVIVSNSLHPLFARGEGGCVVPGTCSQHDIVSGSFSNSTSVISCGNYSWNGQTLNTTGIYTDSLFTVNGCDSIEILDLTIVLNYSDTIVDSACVNYSWNGQIYSVTGYYSDTILNALGCDTILTLDLTITSGFTDSVSVNSCGSYLWNGQTYTNSGMYTDSLISINGCDSIVSLYLTIEQDYSDTIVVSSCTDYIWNGQTYTSNGFYSDSLISITGCDSVTTLDLTINSISESPFIFTLLLDDYCLETTWELINSSNSVLYSGGPYDCFPSGGGNNANQTITETLYLSSLDCYTLTIYDAYSDGLNGSYWGGTDGSWDLIDNLGATMFSGSGDFGDSVYVNFMVTSYVDSACLAPTSFTGANITTTSIELSWVPGSTETEWNIEYGTAGFTQGSGTLINGVTSNPYVVNSLTSLTDYDFYIQAVCSGDSSVWVGPFAATTLNINEGQLIDFNIYPNPSNGEIIIASGNSILENITVYNVIGEKVFLFYPEISNNKISLNLSNLSFGTYFIEVVDSNGFKGFKKMIIK